MMELVPLQQAIRRSGPPEEPPTTEDDDDDESNNNDNQENNIIDGTTDDDDDDIGTKSLLRRVFCISHQYHAPMMMRVGMMMACYHHNIMQWVSLLVGTMALAILIAIIATMRSVITIRTIVDYDSPLSPSSITPITTTIAFCGNSMLYYNDCPRLVEIMLLRLQQQEDKNHTDTARQHHHQRFQDSCLRGGSNLASLWDDGNGMESRFGINNDDNDIGAPTVESLLLLHPPSQSDCWNFVVLQDHEECTTGHCQNTSLHVLREKYLPTIIKQSRSRNNCNNDQTTTVLLLETFAYQNPRLRETIHGLGSLDEFTNALVEGYDTYANVVRDEFGLNCHVIPMATAVQQLAANDDLDDDDDEVDDDLWTRLYNRDGVHPSPHATWLQACLIVAVATGRPPPTWDDTVRTEWLRRARYWQGGGHHHEDLPLPTIREAEILRQLACQLSLGVACV